MIDFSKPVTQESYYTAKSSELLVSYNVCDENRNYEFDNVVFAHIKNGVKKISIPNMPVIDLYPDMVIMGTTKLSANVSLPEACLEKPMTCFSLEISKEQVWNILDKINKNYGVPDLISEGQTMPSTNLYFGNGGKMVLNTLNKIKYLLTENVEFKDYWIDLKIEELVLYSLQTNMRDTLIHSYNKNQISDHPLAHAIHYIKENLYSKIDIKTLADKAFMSKATFFRQFKHHFGITPVNFIHNERIKEAQKLLDETNKSISEIGYSLGYTNPSYFASQFEKRMGVLPANYKKTKLIN